jgi:proteasome lid subunit RPN8/RPN11
VRRCDVTSVKHDAAAALVDHARAAAPDECCGLLLGRGDDIVAALPARNIADDAARRFLIDPADHFAARRAARERGLEVVGFYHSHPHSPAEPSARDVAEFTYPGYFYAIVSLASEPAEIQLFRWDAGNFHRMSFVTVR